MQREMGPEITVEKTNCPFVLGWNPYIHRVDRGAENIKLCGVGMPSQLLAKAREPSPQSQEGRGLRWGHTLDVDMGRVVAHDMGRGTLASRM